ncbi:MAG: fasciclin domain-containing protein [Vulcanococcus sp.]
MSREPLVLVWYSLEGAPIPIRRAEPFEVKNATVIQADVVCDNGVVHVMNRVILPG